jgi:hypothetical protein
MRYDRRFKRDDRLARGERAADTLRHAKVISIRLFHKNPGAGLARMRWLFINGV